MRAWHRRPLFLLLLLSILAPGLARSPQSLERRDGQVLAPRDSTASKPASEQPVGLAQLNPVGTKDAPIDGKDGKPHAGPFVETEAERDRKKAKDSADEEPAIIPSAGPVKEQADLRQSNDGVMNDPNRMGPKDGTRGTEGGVSEKSKESKVGEEKKPDPPKEAPPLPHSEQEMMRDHPSKDIEKASEEEKQLLEVLISLDCNLRVGLTRDGRNQRIYQANPMTYQLRKTLHHQKTTFSSRVEAHQIMTSRHL